MKYITHVAILFVWFAATRYAMVNLEQNGYDLGLVAIIFICGVMACAQALLLLTEAEDMICE